MQPRLKFVLLFFAVAGIGLLFVRPKDYTGKTEKWMEAAVPTEVPGYSLVNSSLGEARMDESTYNILQPFGIVVRQYLDAKGRSFDFTVIAGNTRKPFHDPQVCFSAQNWALIDPKMRKVNIPAIGGRTPATVMIIEKPGSRGIAMYFYKSPLGWRHSPLYVPFDLTAAKLMLWDRPEAQFYRFIMNPATPPEDRSPEGVEKALQKDIAVLENFANTVFEGLAKTNDGKYFVSNQ